MAASLFGASNALEFTLNSIDGQSAPLARLCPLSSPALEALIEADVELRRRLDSIELCAVCEERARWNGFRWHAHVDPLFKAAVRGVQG